MDERSFYTQQSRAVPHQGVRVGMNRSTNLGNNIYISTAWSGEKYRQGTFISAEDAEDLAVVLLYYARKVREK